MKFLPQIMIGVGLIALVIGMITMTSMFSYWLFGLSTGVSLTALIWELFSK